MGDDDAAAIAAWRSFVFTAKDTDEACCRARVRTRRTPPGCAVLQQCQEFVEVGSTRCCHHTGELLYGEWNPVDGLAGIELSKIQDWVIEEAELRAIGDRRPSSDGAVGFQIPWVRGRRAGIREEKLCAGSCSAMVSFRVVAPNGADVGVFEIPRGRRVRQLRNDIAQCTNTCKCSFDMLISDRVFNPVHDCIPIHDVAQERSYLVVQMHCRSPNLSDKVHCARYCAKCLSDAGATALFILQIWTEQNMFIDAVALRRAGFALRDVVNARANIHSLNHAHPILDWQTLFDPQLRSAGYPATDFREIGYTVAQMSSTRFYCPAFQTGSEQEWNVTMAFFTAEELIQAGFDAEEVRTAFEHLEFDGSF
jgi:hypothetical protein